MENINRVTITGNLTGDPEVRDANGTPVATLRVAVNGRRKDSDGNWKDKPNYFNVIVWGKQGTLCGEHLSKGRPVAVDGRLDWRDWTDKEGNKRQSIEIVAETVQFLGTGQATGNNATGASSQEQPVGAAAGGADDSDIPF
ncbi:MAG: single-stranded DNA-binding protein [Solirubrobacterales bacterium]|nr:single-stranded DNA-binding protein [Solirubrobacterales bacterium]